MEGHSHISHEGFKEEETLVLEGLMTRGRLKKLQGEVQQELVTLKDQGEAKEGHTMPKAQFRPIFLVLIISIARVITKGTSKSVMIVNPMFHHSKGLALSTKNTRASLKKRKLILPTLDDEEEVVSKTRPPLMVEEEDDGDDVPLVIRTKRKAPVEEPHGAKPFNPLVLIAFLKGKRFKIELLELDYLLPHVPPLCLHECQPDPYQSVYTILEFRNITFLSRNKEETYVEEGYQDTLTHSWFVCKPGTHLMCKLIEVYSKLRVQHFMPPSLVINPSTKILIQPNRISPRLPMIDHNKYKELRVGRLDAPHPCNSKPSIRNLSVGTHFMSRYNGNICPMIQKREVDGWSPLWCGDVNYCSFEVSNAIDKINLVLVEDGTYLASHVVIQLLACRKTYICPYISASFVHAIYRSCHLLSILTQLIALCKEAAWKAKNVMEEIQR
ncbi:hypothetical protein CR513_03341, partial [Mucuna pruriens]